jgi:hypothetical protein
VVSTITATQLQKWFAEAAVANGFEKAFEVLADKLRGDTVVAEEVK